MVFCNICNIDIKNLSQHNLTDKHRKLEGLEKIEKKKYIYDGNYQKEYNEYRKINGQNIVKCEVCEKNIHKYNLSHHKKTIKHLKKLNGEIKIEPYNYEEVEIII